jgi:hypothetical protein
MRIGSGTDAADRFDLDFDLDAISRHSAEITTRWSGCLQIVFNCKSLLLNKLRRRAKNRAGARFGRW